jgi:hypothetical protein
MRATFVPIAAALVVSVAGLAISIAAGAGGRARPSRAIAHPVPALVLRKRGAPHR